jgi:hypothetical protein
VGRAGWRQPLHDAVSALPGAVPGAVLSDHRGMNTPRPVLAWLATTLAASVLAAVPQLAAAQGSLADKRLAITKGTAPGQVLIELPPAGAGAASAPAAAGSGASAASAATSGKPARTGLFSRLPPPSGRPMNAAQRLDAPDLGIVIQPARPASAPR